MTTITGYDINGYNRQGLDRYGYNQEGFDSEGFNITGYSRIGEYDGIVEYGKDGYNIEGFNRYLHYFCICSSVIKPAVRFLCHSRAISRKTKLTFTNSLWQLCH